jgi:hypothetical protein
MPKTVERWRWYTPQPGKKKLTLTRYHFTEREAFERFGPDVQGEPASRELRAVLVLGEDPAPNRR